MFIIIAGIIARVVMSEKKFLCDICRFDGDLSIFYESVLDKQKKKEKNYNAVLITFYV